jgi:ABC-type uncharacterized transport system ATPase component
MKLSFKSIFQSIKTFDTVEILDFSIITGLNGSGKTHLLRAIENGSIQVDGIDTSEIIYYNYNDFNVHYDEDSEKKANLNLRYGQNGHVLAYKLNLEKTELLRLYTLQNDVINQFLNILENDGLGLEFRSWSEEKIEQYIVNISEKQYLLGFSGEVIHLKELVLKYKALMFINENSFNIELVNWHFRELFIYEDLFNKNSTLNILGQDVHGKFSPNFQNFISSYQTFRGTRENPTKEDIVTFTGYLKSIIVELEDYLNKNLSPDSIKLLRGTLGELSLLTQVSSESGFLDLALIAQEEKNYQLLRNQNKYNRFLHESDGQAVSFLDDEAFAKVNGKSPIKLLNEALLKYDCNGYEFRCNELPNQYGIDLNQFIINISLYNKHEEYPTTLEALSSGERTLLALTFYVFKLKYRKKMVSRLLLLDEIDASLHPSMSKRVINVLYGLFYNELGIKVIMSTHSPSTVAFAPEKKTLCDEKRRNQTLGGKQY